MKTRSVDLMLSQPGIYVGVTGSGFSFFEVESDGKCHQLHPCDFTRYGELAPGGWCLGNEPVFYGPLARP